MHIVEAVVKVNDSRKRAMGRKVLHALTKNAAGSDANGKTVALLALVFESNTDDMRDAPSIAIVQALRDAGANVRAYDPEGMTAARRMMPEITCCKDAYDAASGAHAVVIITQWDAFSALDLIKLKATMATPVLVDLRNIYSRDDVENAGFAYTTVGR